MPTNNAITLYMIWLQNGEFGPYTLEEVQEYLVVGQIRLDTKVRKKGAFGWSTVGKLGLQKGVPLPLDAAFDSFDRELKDFDRELRRGDKRRIDYVAVALVLGCLGFHNFYAGKPGWGILQLLISCTGYGLFLTVPWGWLDAFRDPFK